MSLLEHRPVGWASAVVVVVGVVVAPGSAVGVSVAPVAGDVGVGLDDGDASTAAGAEVTGDGSAPTGRVEGPFASPPPPRRCATPKTRANATAMTSSRRVQ